MAAPSPMLGAVLGGCLAGAWGSCRVEMEQESSQGPGGCFAAGGADLITDPFAKAVASCYMQCMAAFTIEQEEVSLGSNGIVAEPLLSACEHPELSMTCSTLRLRCSEPASIIPNICTSDPIGLVRRPRMVWHADFWTTRTADPGHQQRRLFASIYQDNASACNMEYVVQEGICVGITGRADQCKANLLGPDLSGPETCQGAGGKASGAACLKQCAEGYYIEAQEDGPNIAMAYPVQRVCTWSKADDVDFIDAEECPDVRLVCAEPFGVFPNACSGTAHLAKQWFVSFYSFSKETAPGTFETSLQTRVVVDRDTTCAGTYQISEGSCLGLAFGFPGAKAALAPPRPPEIPKMPAAFPTVGEEEAEVSTTARPLLGTEDKNAFVWVVSGVVVVFVALSAVILRWNRLSNHRSSQEIGREIELQSATPF